MSAELKETLSIHRPVLNIGEFDYDWIRETALSFGVAEDKITMPSNDADKAVILTPGEVLGFYRKTGIQFTEAEIEELGDYVHENLPETADQELVIPALPTGEHNMLGRNNTLIFTAGTANPIIREERKHVTGLVEAFYDVEPSDYEEELWPAWDYMSEVWIARTRGQEAAPKFRALMRKAAHLMVPETITLGTITTDNYKYHTTHEGFDAVALPSYQE